MYRPNHPLIDDLSMVTCIASAINKLAISRLYSTEAGLSKDAAERKQALTEVLFSNFKKLREMMEANPNSIPHIGLYIGEFEKYRESPIVSVYAPYKRFLTIRERLEKIKITPFPFQISDNVSTAFNTFKPTVNKILEDKASKLEPKPEEGSRPESSDILQRNPYPSATPSTTPSRRVTRSTSKQPLALPQRKKLIAISNEDSAFPFFHEKFPEFSVAPYDPNNLTITIGGKSLKDLLDDRKKDYDSSPQNKIKLYHLVKFR